jgi:hypothetical protein
MPVSRRKPKLQDEALSDLAQMFITLPDDPTPGSEALDSSKLDFSLSSLVVIDKHLAKIRRRKLEDDDLIKFVLRCGAYVGEVIRRNSKAKTYHWLDFEEAARLSTDVKHFGRCLPTVAILWDNKSGFTFPLGKVVKFLENGPEDSVHFFAKVMISKTD